jgi:uncharacterized RDD family membrane protein YckC
LSERVREIQARRAREAALEAEAAAARRSAEPPAEEVSEADADGFAQQTPAEGQHAPQLGLVPPTEMPEMNPLVAAALRRIERARQVPPPVSRSARGAAATAVARLAEEQYETAHESPPAAAPRAESRTTVVAETDVSSEALKAEKPADGARAASGLVVVSHTQGVRNEPAAAPAAAVKTEEPLKISAAAGQTPAAANESKIEAQAKVSAPKTEAARALPRADEGGARAAGGAPETRRPEGKPQPRHVKSGVIDDSWLTRLDAEILPRVVSARDVFDDHAPLSARFLGAVADLFIVVFLSSPFAAIIELTSGNWSDPRVAASMGGILLTVMFLYLAGSTALAGRTPGMKLFSLHTVDAATALAPSTGQSVRRTLVYMLSLATFGLGLLYALFDAEGRTAHDHLSGTIIVRE